MTTVRTLGWSVLLHGAALGTAVWLGSGVPRPARPALAVELLPTEDAVAVETTPLPREAVVVESVEVEPPLAEPVEEELEVEAGAFDPRVEAIFVPPRDERRASAWLATARRPLAPPAAAAPAEPPAPLRPTPAAHVLEVIPGRNPPPAYPWLARRRGWEGTVVVQVRVDADGAVGAAAVVRSSGRAALDEAALAAVRTWRFRGGPGETSVEVAFVLQRSGR
ncbi:MAG TPA: TonB family protein [Planctomycetota bacterium]|nr:TonB family protein [Planctomycetota bacterium]